MKVCPRKLPVCPEYLVRKERPEQLRRLLYPPGFGVKKIKRVRVRDLWVPPVVKNWKLMCRCVDSQAGAFSQTKRRLGHAYENVNIAAKMRRLLGEENLTTTIHTCHDKRCSQQQFCL